MTNSNNTRETRANMEAEGREILSNAGLPRADGDGYTDEIKDEVVRLYREGRKGEDIATAVGIPRPSVYVILQKMGVRPSRQKIMQQRQFTVEQALEMVAARDREIGRLEGQIARLEAQIDILRQT